MAKSIAKMSFDSLVLNDSMMFSTCSSDTLSRLNMGTVGLWEMPPYCWCEGKLLATAATESTKYSFSISATMGGSCERLSLNLSSICFLTLFCPIHFFICCHICLESPFRIYDYFKEIICLGFSKFSCHLVS